MSLAEPAGHDEELDLRELLETLCRRRWFILSITLAAVVAAAVLSFLVLPPVYQSRVTVALPPADAAEEEALDLPPRAYRELAASRPVMAAVREELGLDLTLEGVRGHFDIELEPDARLLTVTASAGDPEGALALAREWATRFAQAAQGHLAARLHQQRAGAEQAFRAAAAALEQAEEQLTRFDRQYPLDLLRARLETLEGELVRTEARFRELTATLIPTDRARLAALRQTLAAQARTLEGSRVPLILPEPDPAAGVTGSAVTLLNPVYLRLSQDLADTQVRLTSYEEEARNLERRIASLEAETADLRNRLVPLRVQRERLARALREAQVTYRREQARLDRLQSLASRIPDLAATPVLSEPTLPEAPVSPRKLLNMLVAMVLGGIAGVVGAFMTEWWRASARPPAVARESPPTGEAL